MDVKIVGVGYMVDKRPRSLMGYALNYFQLDKASLFHLSDEDAVVLNDINLQVKQGGVTVFMGLGIGHRCLIECIALRQREGLMSGKILYDGVVRKNGIFKDIVLIHDLGVTHFNSLSVFDYLYFGARLRISQGVIECRERARQAARLVNLDGTRRIGSLSRAELRILDIAAELVSNPTLICVLDPTEGLDASSKIEVMKVLKNIASRVSMPTTVIYNISSIDYDTIGYIDELAIFSGRNLAYTNSLLKFREISIASVTNLLIKASLIIIDELQTSPYSKAEGSHTHYLTLMKVVDELLSLEAQRTKIEQSTDRVRKTQFFAAGRRTGEAGLPVRYRKSLWKEFSILAMRSLKFHYRNGVYLRMIFVRFTLACFLVGGLAYNDGEAIQSQSDLVTGSYNLPYKPAYNASSACFILVAMSLVGVAFTVRHLHANVLLLKFEVNSGLQGVVSSWLSLILIDLPIYTLIAIIISLIMYYMVDINGSMNTYLGTTFMVLLTGYSVALNCAIWCSSLRLAKFTFAFIGSIFLLFCGYLQVIDNLSLLWFWMSRVAFTRWAFEAYMIATFKRADDGDNYLAIYNFEDVSASSCNGWMLMWLFGLQIIVVLGLLPPWSRLDSPNKEEVTVKVSNDYMAFQSNHAKYTPPQDAIADYDLNRDTYKGLYHTDIYSNTGNNIASVNDLNPNKASVNGLSVRRDIAKNKPATMSEKPDDIPVLERSATSFGFTLTENPAKTVFAPKDMVTTLRFDRIKYVQDSTASDQTYAEPVLNGVSGTITPGTCVCFIDAQEDRSSLILLQILANLNRNKGKTTGVVTANNHKIGKKQNYVNAAYVQRGDATCLASLTVKEALTYAALLRRTDRYNAFPRFMTSNASNYVNEYEELAKSSDVNERVKEVLSLLGLENVSNRTIGAVTEQRQRFEHRDKSLSVARHLTSYRQKLRQYFIKPVINSITPAQLRLVTIGIELVNRPGLIFVEDPFYGLEWQDAERVAVVLRTLAEGNRTVICNIEKPAQRIVQYFHEMYLLGSGLCIYSGPTASVGEYFDNIGFQRTDDQSVLDYVLDIAADRGKMRVANGKRAAALSPEDLADLNRSLVNIKAGKNPSIKEDGMIVFESEDEMDTTIGNVIENPLKSHFRAPSHTSSAKSSFAGYSIFSPTRKLEPDYYYAFEESVSSMEGNGAQSPIHSSNAKAPESNAIKPKQKETNMTVSRSVREAAIGPTAWVLLRRGFVLLLNDRAAIYFYLFKCLLAGIVMGSVWYQVDHGDVQARFSLFASIYIALNIQVVDSLEGVYKRKDLFVRESYVKASNYIAHYLMDSAPSLVLFGVGTFITLLFTYILSGLRAGGGPFFYLYIIVFASIYCNYALAYIISMLVSSAAICKTIYTGVIMPLQLLMSGYLILIPTMESWSFWGSYICPMTYFLAGAMRNECSDNSRCLSDSVNYGDIEDEYGYHLSRGNVFFILFLMGLIYKILWFVTLRAFELIKRRAVRKKVSAIRKKARKFIKATLRWSEHYTSTASTAQLEEDSLAELDK